MSKAVNPETITFRVSKNFTKHLEKISLTQSSKAGRRISMSEIIRETLYQAYPLPKKERDIFDKDRK